MNIFRILIFLILINISKLPGQTETKLFSEAEYFFNNDRFASALPLYINLLKTDSYNAFLNFKIGVCYLNSRSQKHKAINYFEKAVAFSSSLSNLGLTKETDAPIIIYKLLGDVYQLTYKFELALAAYEKYKGALKAKKTKDPGIFEMVDKKIEMCLYGKEFKESVVLPSNFKPGKFNTNSGKTHDSICGNYTSVLSADKTLMIYTFKIPLVNIKLPEEDEKYFENSNSTHPLVSAKQSTIGSKNLSIDITQDTIINITTVAASVDGQIVLSYKDDNGDGNLYITRLNQNKWSTPDKLAKTINAKGWEPNEYVSADGNTLYFASNRPGGFGGNDIYKCKKLENGEWSKAKNLGAIINTPFDDEAPFIHPDGITLYFSSNRNKPKECFDNYISTIPDSGSCTSPVIAGYPIDKTKAELFYQITNDKKTYSIQDTKDDLIIKKKKFAANNNTKDEKENYIVSFINSNNVSLTLLTGHAIEVTAKSPKQTLIKVSDNETGQLTAVYHSDNKGHFSFILPPAINNNITYEADDCVFVSENINVGKNESYYENHNTVCLYPLAEKSKIILNNVFFELNSTKISPWSTIELNRLSSFLMNTPNIKVKIKNCIFSHERSKALKILSKQRAQAIVNYLVEKGINKKNLMAKGYKKTISKEKKEKEIEAFKEKAIQQLELEIIEIKQEKKNNLSKI